MRRILVITFIGPDRPGIVDGLSKIVVDHGANWEESRMASLSGRFAGMLEVAVDPDRAEDLVAALGKVEDLSMFIEHGEPVQLSGVPWQLELVGTDQPGIVQDIASVLAARQINIEDLTTEHEEGAMSGGMIFRAFANLTGPEDIDVDELSTALEQLADDLMVEISLERH